MIVTVVQRGPPYYQLAYIPDKMEIRDPFYPQHNRTFDQGAFW